MRIEILLEGNPTQEESKAIMANLSEFIRAGGLTANTNISSCADIGLLPDPQEA